MFDRAKPKETAVMRSLGALAKVLAFVLAFLFTPVFHGETVDWAIGYMYDNYGSWVADIGWYIWFVLSALLTFFISTVVLMILLQILYILSQLRIFSFVSRW